MKTFIQWAKGNKLDLPISEDRLRGGIRPAYPDAYAAAQYPAAYFSPHSATADLDLANRKKIKNVAPPDGAP